MNYEQPQVENTKEAYAQKINPVVGDYVVWESGGALQWDKPKKIESIHEDSKTGRQYALFADSGTGIPLDELTLPGTEYDESDEQVEKKFEDASLEEQYERAGRIQELLYPNSAFMDFWRNIYKYSDRITIPGVQNDQEKQAYFSQAEGGLGLLNHAFNFYVQMRRSQAGTENSINEEERMLKEGIELAPSQFASRENYQVDIEKLTNMFEWSLAVYFNYGQKLGREVTITADKINQLVEDVEIILTRVNQGR